MNNLAQGVLSVDSHGIVRMYNAAALGILDTNGSLNGHHIDEVFQLSDEKGKRVHIFSIMKKASLPKSTTTSSINMPMMLFDWRYLLRLSELANATAVSI